MDEILVDIFKLALLFYSLSLESSPTVFYQFLFVLIFDFSHIFMELIDKTFICIIFEVVELALLFFSLFIYPKLKVYFLLSNLTHAFFSIPKLGLSYLIYFKNVSCLLLYIILSFSNFCQFIQ